MSGSAKAEDISAAIEESAKLIGAAYSPERVRPVLATFEQALPEAMVVFSAQTGPRYAGQLDYSLTVPAGTGGLYARARSDGLIAETDHPVGHLLPNFEERYPFSEYFVDCGAAAGGLRKLYVHFPQDQQKVAALAEIPSMPPAVAANAPLFARYGLESVAMMGVGCKSETMSLYFQFSVENRPEPRAIGLLLREIGMPEPDERMLEFAHRALRANITFSWDSAKILRVAFAPPPGRGLDPATVPAPMPPEYARFATTAPRAYGGERVNLFAVKWMPDGQFLEVCSYYQLSAMQRRLFIPDHEE
jgi:hypothetical protein